MKKAVIFLLMLTLSGCAGSMTTEIPTPTPTQQAAETSSPYTGGEKPIIEIVMEDGGIITAELYPDIAPITVENFLKLIDSNFFDGLIFHRVIPGFMIQGGGYTKDGKIKHADSIKGEFASNGVKNTLKHTRGVLSMARTSEYNSASSQFFIMVDDAPHLDGDYAAFGAVISGMEVADKIVNQERDHMDKPLKDQVIKTIRRK